MATVEREVTEYDRAELEAIKAATPSEMVQLARRFDERRQTPVSAGALIAALLRDVATDTPWLEIEPLAARGPVVVRALAAVVMASLELRVSRTPRDAARYCWLVDSFSGLDVGQHAIAMGLYHSGRLGLALDLLERLDTHLGAVGVELALFVDGDVGAAVERFAKEIRQSLEFGDPELALRVVACLRAGDPGVFSEPLERAEEWRLAAGLLRAVAMDPRRMDGVPALDEAWTVAAGVAALALATDRVDGERAEAAIERLARHTGVPTQPLVSATLALPEDPVPYSRLAAEEREFVRDFLRMLGSDELLAALPPEPT